MATDVDGTRGRRRGPWLVLVPAIVGVVLVAGAVLAAPARATVEIGIRWSHYQPAVVHVRVGEPVTFVIRNDDPIDHEWIVGDEALHARHRTGTEPYHASRPTEVSIDALKGRTTTVTFDKPGTYTFVCHLPGHEAYGMTGTLTVTGG